MPNGKVTTYEEYPNNSLYAKERKKEQTERKPLEKVVKGTVKKGKKSLGKKFSETSIGENLKEIAPIIGSEIIGPAIGDFFYNVLMDIVDSVFGRSAGKSRHKKYTAYDALSSKYYKVPNERERYSESRERSTRRRAHDFSEYRFDSRIDAADVLDQMFDQIDEYDFISVAEFKDLIGEPSTSVDTKWGWESLGSAKVVRSRDRRDWIIDLPSPRYIE